MSLQGFRDAVEVHVTSKVMGPSAAAGKGKLGSSLDDSLARLRAGEKGWQLRLWMSEDEASQGITDIQAVVGVSLLVARSLLVPEDEAFYLEGEMLEAQQVLLVASEWIALSGAAELVEGPTINGEPERSGPVVTYTLELQMRLNP